MGNAVVVAVVVEVIQYRGHLNEEGVVVAKRYRYAISPTNALPIPMTATEMRPQYHILSQNALLIIAGHAALSRNSITVVFVIFSVISLRCRCCCCSRRLLLLLLPLLPPRPLHRRERLLRVIALLLPVVLPLLPHHLHHQTAAAFRTTTATTIAAATAAATTATTAAAAPNVAGRPLLLLRQHHCQ
jgi:hypothetical protein